MEDIEALRVALGLDKIALYGTSYGVKVALGYALTYPANVERLVLDSVLEVDGPDPLYRPTLEAIPRVLRSLCRSGCRSFTADPLEDLAGSCADGRGRRCAARWSTRAAVAGRRALSRGELFLMLIAGDFDPALRAAFPGAVRAALDGDDDAAAAARPALVLGRGRAAAAAAAQHRPVHAPPPARRCASPGRAPRRPIRPSAGARPRPPRR